MCARLAQPALTLGQTPQSKIGRGRKGTVVQVEVFKRLVGLDCLLKASRILQ